MAAPESITNDNFMYNSMLASALTQLLPARERIIIRTWIDRLHNITPENETDIEIRNEYMWFLLLLLQYKKIVYPFNVLPYSRKLEKLTDIIPPAIYDDVIKNFSGLTNHQWIDQVISHPASENTIAKSTFCKPSNFLKNQPIPKMGILCYMGAFSDQSP